MSSSLTGAIVGSFEKHSSLPCLHINGRAFTFGEIHEKSAALATVLSRRISPHGALGLLAQRSQAAYVSLLASVLSGRPYVPLNMKFPPERQGVMIEAASCELLISDDKSAERHAQLAADFGHSAPLLSDADLDKELQGVAPMVVAGAEDDSKLAYVMFTSGTTGTPKGVGVARNNLTAYLQAIADVAPFHAGARCSQFFDLSFDLSVHDVFRTWAGGGCLFVPTDEEMIDPVGFAARHELDCWFSVPSVVAMAKRMRRLKDDVAPSLKLSLFCGEPLPISLAEAWQSAAPNSKVLNLYGPTEATIAITSQDFARVSADAPRPASVPLGEAFSGSAAVVVNEAGREAGVGETGELWLAGPQLTLGYLNNPIETEAKFVGRRLDGHPFQRWYRTGDLVLKDERHGLVFQARLDQQVKIQGYRVELLEIEESLRAFAGTSDVAAVAWPISATGGAEGIVGFVCGSTIATAEIIAGCRTRLPGYMVPKKIVVIDQVPLNANGKVDRSALRAIYLEAGRPVAMTPSAG
jgi:D-alanine--poly(phosphoribitol) ligase subunit 1